MTVPNEHDREAGGAARQAPPGAQDEAGDVGALQAALAAAEGRALESRDLYMRALAELENVRHQCAVEEGRLQAARVFFGHLGNVQK